jgi:hypothetical protein
MSRGLLRATDRALRAGVSGHHELMLPFICRSMDACSLVDIKSRSFSGVFLPPDKLDARTSARVAHASALATPESWHELSRASGCGARQDGGERAWNVLFHPSKCAQLPSGSGRAR